MFLFNKMFWQYLLPQHLLSRLLGKLAHCSWPWLKQPLIDLFIKHYKIDMSLAEPITYRNFNEFFTRALKPEARPIVGEQDSLACPADGFVSQLGNIRDSRIFQAKGFEFDLLNLLGGSAERALPFKNGKFATLYLSPSDYHRVHMPVTGRLREMVYIPGKLFSVNPNSVSHIENLFGRNERVACIFDTDYGPMALILVGAMIVASIETIWAGLIAPNREKMVQSWDYSKRHVNLLKGEEMGRFQFGSTVIVLFANSKLHWNEILQPESAVKMGQLLGQFMHQD